MERAETARREHSKDCRNTQGGKTQGAQAHPGREPSGSAGDMQGEKTLRGLQECPAREQIGSAGTPREGTLYGPQGRQAA